MRVVIVGAGPAGLTVAESVRARDRGADVVLLAAEPSPPYAPPALADHFLTGRDGPLYWKGRDVCARLGLDFRPGVDVRRVVPTARLVVCADGSTVGYDRLVIATGSRLHAPVPGSELGGIANFKSLRAASELVERARRGQARTAVVVGAGFIGIEVTLLLAALGLAVTLVEAEDQVMPRVLDAETAAIVAAELVRRGVAVRLGAKVAAFIGDRSVREVALAARGGLTADVYVAATGVKPNLELLAGAGVAAGWGVHVDDRLRTSARDVYAAGDVAETTDRLTGERHVHAIFPNAVEQGRVVAANLLGDDVRYPGAESMNSLKHLGVPVVAAGAAGGAEELRWRRGPALRKIFVTDGRIVGFRLTGDVRAAGVLRALMLSRADVTPFRRALADPGFGVSWIAAAARKACADPGGRVQPIRERRGPGASMRAAIGPGYALGASQFHS